MEKLHIFIMDIHSKIETVAEATNLDELYQRLISEIQEKIAN